jgi:predicted dehydrogenase
MTGAKLGVGLAGLGRHGTRYAQHLLGGSVDRARLVAVHRRDADQGRSWAEPRGITFHESLDDLAQDPAVDLMVGVLPPARHPDVVSAAAAASKPVLVEKPLSPDPESARRAMEIANKAGIPAMVAHTLRFNSVIRAVRDYRRHVGELQLIAINHRSEPSGRPWLDDERQGGLVFFSGVHAVDLLRTLSGAEIAEVHGFARDLLTHRVADLFCASLRLEPGSILATVDNSRATGGRSGRIELVGSQGQLIADHVHGFVQLVRDRRAEPMLVEAPVPTVQEALRAFAAAVLEERASPVPLADGLAAVEGAERIRAALSLRRED